MVNNHNKKKYSIMIVEDDSNLLYLLKTILIEHGYKITTASNGLEALLKYNSKIDLIITDIEMPEMNGLQLIEKIRTYDINSKFLIMTGSRNKQIPEDIKVLFKPFNFPSLNRTIEKIMSAS